jgi:hypothetical protein
VLRAALQGYLQAGQGGIGFGLGSWRGEELVEQDTGKALAEDGQWLSRNGFDGGDSKQFPWDSSTWDRENNIIK